MKRTVTDKMRRANRANALHSTGPSTERGKAVSSLNGVTHGLYAKRQEVEINDGIVRRVQDYLRRHAPRPKITDKLYDTGNVRMLDEHLRAALAGEIILDYGPPGTQKTFLFEYRRAEAAKKSATPEILYVRCSPAMSPRALLIHVALEVGAFSRGSRDTLMANILLKLQARRKPAALLVDEAHLLKGQYVTIETLRELADRARLGMVIAGHNDLEEIFREGLAMMEQWVSRIDRRHRLPGLSESEARAIATEELGQMPKAALDALVSFCGVKDVRTRKSYCSMRRLVKRVAQIRARKFGA